MSRSHNSSHIAFDEDISKHDFADEVPSKQYLRQLAKHPNCNDPDHPGCEYCQSIDDTEQWEDEPNPYDGNKEV